MSAVSVTASQVRGEYASLEPELLRDVIPAGCCAAVGLAGLLGDLPGQDGAQLTSVELTPGGLRGPGTA
jgi:hypothetical protein